MTVKKPTKQRKSSASPPDNWLDAIRVYLAKVPEVDAAFVCGENNIIHVYSVVERFHERYYKRLLRQEDLLEKAFPEVAFEFHTRAHQGRKPVDAVPFDAYLVFQR